MPKIMMHLQEQILLQAEKTLQQDGPAAVTIRNIASQCGIAIGTIYNYYPNKDALIGDVVLKRWQKTKALIQKNYSGADTFVDGFCMIHDGLKSFVGENRNVWMETSNSKQFNNFYREQHSKLTLEIENLIVNLFNQFPKERDRIYAEYGAKEVPAFLSENLLLCFTNENISIGMLLKLFCIQ